MSRMHPVECEHGRVIDGGDFYDQPESCAVCMERGAAMWAFLDASVAVWREIDRLSAMPGGYPGIDDSSDLRRVERAAWERYRNALDRAAPAGLEDKGET